MTVLKTFIILLVAGLLGAGVFIYSGIYNVAADAPHYKPTFMLIEALRSRSIKVRAEAIEVPEGLSDNARVRRGAGNYDAMCVGCHLKPGLTDTEIRKGLYPQPPNLGEQAGDPARQFWAIKHGIKMSAMPAWAKGGMDDETIWDMVALLQALPDMSAREYQRFVASSEGHSHPGADDHGHHWQAGTAHSDAGATEPGPGHAHEHDEQPKMPTPEKTPHHHHDDSGSKPHAH